MAKRFVDTKKYRKPFVRGLPGPYKLLWDYLCLECDHAGLWIKDFEIAQIHLGKDMPVTEDEALKLFNNGEVRIIPLKSGSLWCILPFVEFQYGKLNPDNKVHRSVLGELEKAGLDKGLARGLQGAKDKEKDKDMEKDKDKALVMDKDKDLVPIRF